MPIAFIVILVFAICIFALFEVPQFKGYRTHIMGAFLAIGGGLVPLLADTFVYLQTIDWTQLLTGKQAAVAALAIGVLVIIFRRMANIPKPM
jgi:hypothetical protein